MNTFVSLILLDIEGCLTTGKGRNTEAEWFSEISHLYEDKSLRLAPLVLCTGRPQPYAEAIYQCLGMLDFDCVTSTGNPMASVVENGCFLYVCRSQQKGGDLLIPDPSLTDKIPLLMELKTWIREDILNKNLGLMEPGKEYCISLNPTFGTVETLFEQIKTQIPKHLAKVVSIRHSNSAVDITPLGIDKASGVRNLSNWLGIPLDNMVVVGDSNGDLPAMALVGHPAAVANASQEVKKLVEEKKGFIANAAYGEGVLQIINYFNQFSY